MEREALKQALVALENCYDVEDYPADGDTPQDKAITAIKAALAQPAQEPVCPECKAEVLYECVACSRNNYPTQREWVGLTDEEMWSADYGGSDIINLTYAKNIENKLKEKNFD